MKKIWQLVLFCTIILIGIIIWLIIGNSSDNTFWHFNFYDIIMLLITLFLGIIVTYYLPERNTKTRVFNNIYMEKAKEIKEYLNR